MARARKMQTSADWQFSEIQGDFAICQRFYFGNYFDVLPFYLFQNIFSISANYKYR